MNYYVIVKFIHIVSAMGLFIALGVEWLSLWSARNATTSEQIRERLRISSSAQRLGPLSMLLLLISGFYMIAVARIGSPWLIVAFGALILLVVLALTLTNRRIAAIRQALTVEKESVSPSPHEMLNHSLLWLSIRLRVSI